MSTLDWAFLISGAVLVGFSKTAVGSAGSIAVALFAVAIPARESTGAILPLLLVGDLIAVVTYRGQASWGTLGRLVPGVLPGLVVGAWFITLVDDEAMRVVIGLSLLLVTGVQLATRRPSRKGRVTGSGGPSRHASIPVVAAVGFVAGFTSMTANAAGSVLALYLVLAGLPMLNMLGTTAWFFLIVNLTKLPFSAGLDLISVHSLVVDAALVPALALGALAGVRLVRRIEQEPFERLALGGTAAAGLALVL